MRAASFASNPPGSSAGSAPGGRATTFTSKPCVIASSIPRSAADSPASVAVEREPEPLRQSSELAQLLLGERRAHRRDNRLEPRLPERDHIGVALDDAGPVLLRDRRAGLVEAVDDRALVEELRLGRVHVLRFQRVVLVQAPRLEADDTPARVGEREDEPALEVVVAALPRQPRRAQLVGGEALLQRPCAPSVVPPSASPSRNSRQISSRRPRPAR